MAKQLLQNSGFENDLDSYITQGSVSTNSDFAYSGTKSALLMATPTAIAELSQVVLFISPGSPVNFSFFTRSYLNENVENVSNFRIEVNFVSFIGTVIPPGIVIKGRGRDISEKEWKRFNGYAVAPFGTIAAQVVIRLEPPADGTSGLLVDDLKLLAEVTIPAQSSAEALPMQPGIPMFPNIPFNPPPVPMPQGIPTLPGIPFAQPPATLPPAQQQNTVFPFPGMPINMTPPAPASPVQQENPALPGSPFANLKFQGALFNKSPEPTILKKKED